MKLMRVVLIVLTVLLITLTGCAAKENALLVPLGNAPDNWPSDIPDAILPFPGTLEDIMVGDIYIRMFYRDVSKETVYSYAKAMEENGFTAEFYAYTADGSNHGKQIKSGQFDGVRLKKRCYNLLLELDDYGATLSVEGFIIEIPFPWPDSWGAYLPCPEGVSFPETRLLSYNDNYLEALGAYFEPGFSDEQNQKKTETVNNYINLLLSSGFQKATDADCQENNFHPRVDTVSYISDDVIVAVVDPLIAPQTNLMAIEAMKIS